MRRDRNDADGTSTSPPGDRHTGTSRRDVLKTTAGLGAIAAGLGSGAVGSVAADGIPTPWLHRDGNLIRDPDGNRVILRGVNVPDPSRLNADNYYSYDVEDYVTWATNGDSPPGTTDPNGWYSRIVRIPAQPVDIGGHDPGGAPPAPAFDQAQLDSYVQNHLRPAVDFCAERDVYCIVDYHRHRGQYDENLYFTSDAIDEELRLFWNTVAPEFAADSHVLYEVYNEPTEPYPDDVDPAADNQAALDAWNQWRDAAQPWVDIIRSHAPDTLILIGSPRWSQWTAQAPRNEFDGENLAYTGHVYGQEGLQPFSEYFGAPAEEVPVFLTEWGYKTGRAPYLSGTTDAEGQMFLDLFENYPIHPVPWIFDFRWVPQFFDRQARDDWELLRTNDTHGGLVKDLLYDNRNADLPAGDGGDTDDTTAPATPSNLSATDETSSSITVGWDASSDTGGSGLDGYVVYVDGSQDQTVATGTTSATVSGLAADTSYTIGVSAVDGAGNESSTVAITTSTDADGTDDTTAPTAPSNLATTGSTSASIAVDWDASTDEGGSGLAQYNVSLDGSQDQTVAAGTTEATVVGLSPDTTYEIGVSAVDGAGNESDTTTLTATTPPGDPVASLLVNDYDGDPAWSGQNDLGNWNGAGSFENGDGEVVDGELVLEYDDAGWAQERIDRDVSDYTDLVVAIRGAAGGEGQHFAISLGGATDTFADVADSAVTTSSSEVHIDMQAAGIDRTAPAQLQLDFWQGGSGASTIYVDEIRFE